MSTATKPQDTQTDIVLSPDTIYALAVHKQQLAYLGSKAASSHNANNQTASEPSAEYNRLVGMLLEDMESSIAEVCPAKTAWLFVGNARYAVNSQADVPGKQTAVSSGNDSLLPMLNELDYLVVDGLGSLDQADADELNERLIKLDMRKDMVPLEAKQYKWSATAVGKKKKVASGTITAEHLGDVIAQLTSELRDPGLPLDMKVVIKWTDFLGGTGEHTTDIGMSADPSSYVSDRFRSPEGLV